MLSPAKSGTFTPASTAYFIAKGKRPTIPAFALAVGTAVIVTIFIGAQREHLFYGSDKGVDKEKIGSYFRDERQSKGGTFVTAAGSILTAVNCDKYHWGRRYLVNYLVRPIPRQLLADKDRIYAWGMANGITERDWYTVMHWTPESGYATGFTADLFLEFSWFGVIGAFLYGMLFGFVWRYARIKGGIWLIVFGIALMLVIYVPTQSISAFLQRFLFMSGLSWISWHLLLSRQWDRWQRMSGMKLKPAVNMEPPVNNPFANNLQNETKRGL